MASSSSASRIRIMACPSFARANRCSSAGSFTNLVEIRPWPALTQTGFGASLDGMVNKSRHQNGGMIPGTAGEAAFSVTLGEGAPVPVLLAVPHAGRVYPPDLQRRMRHPAAASLRLEDRF